MPENYALKRFVIACNPQLAESYQVAEKISAFLMQHGAEHTECASIYDEQMQAKIEKDFFDAMITLGGDGTMLRASHLCAPQKIPIVGINLGTFGFLIELQKQEWPKYFKRLIEGKYRIEERMMLHAEHYRSEQLICSGEVVNEVVVCRGELVRPLRLHAEVDGFAVASYNADGLIAATATGSTAYALAAGGAIMPPELRNILLVPVAPHLSSDRAIILSEGAFVTIRVESSHQAVLSMDGHDPVIMENGDFVRVEASELNVYFIRFHDAGFFYRNLNRYMGQNPTVAKNK